MIFSQLRWIPTPFPNFLIEFGRITRAIFFNIGGNRPPCPPCPLAGATVKMIFDSSMKHGSLSEAWKRANMVPIHTKNSKNLKVPLSLIFLLRKSLQSSALTCRKQKIFQSRARLLSYEA